MLGKGDVKRFFREESLKVRVINQIISEGLSYLAYSDICFHAIQSLLIDFNRVN